MLLNHYLTIIKTYIIVPWFNEEPLKIMKNTFYFTLAALFVRKIFKFFSDFFGHIGK